MPTSAGTGAGALPRPSGSPERRSSVERGPIFLASGSTQLPLDHLQGVAQAAVDAHGGRGLIADVDHAVLAPGVLPVTIIVPGGFVQEVREARMVDVGDQVARALPPLDVASRGGPGGALHLALPLEEFLIDRRGVEAVLAEHR